MVKAGSSALTDPGSPAVPEAASRRGIENTRVRSLHLVTPVTNVSSSVRSYLLLEECQMFGGGFRIIINYNLTSFQRQLFPNDARKPSVTPTGLEV